MAGRVTESLNRIPKKIQTLIGGLLLFGLYALLMYGILGLIFGFDTREDHKRIEWQKVIVDKVRYLTDSCKNAAKKNQEIVIRGKCIIWDMNRDMRSEEHDKLSRKLKAVHPDEKITIFLVEREYVNVGKYRITKFVAWRPLFHVYVIYWPEKTPVGMLEIWGGDPPEARQYKGPNIGKTTGEERGYVAKSINRLKVEE